MAEARVRASVRVSGRVQGVFFRASTQSEARRLGLTGWVRNEADGSVRLLAEGERAQVEALIAWARRGPRHARVDGVEVGYEPALGDLDGFTVRD